MSTCTFSLVIKISRESEGWASSQQPSDSHHSTALSDSQKALPQFLMRSAFPWSCKYWTFCGKSQSFTKYGFVKRLQSSLCLFSLLKHIIAAQSTGSCSYLGHLNGIDSSLSKPIYNPTHFLPGTNQFSTRAVVQKIFLPTWELGLFSWLQKAFWPLWYVNRNPELKHSEALTLPLKWVFFTIPTPILE